LALVSPDGVAPSWMVGVSASVNLPLHHKVQKFFSGTGSPGWSWKRAVRRLCVCVCGVDLVTGTTSGRREPLILQGSLPELVDEYKHRGTG